MIKPTSSPTGPLAGVRVLDLTQLVAGPVATRTLAALGAEVIKIEWRDRLDNIRFNPPLVLDDDPATWALVLGGVSADAVPSANRSGFFNDLNAGKLGLGLNLKDDDDRALFADLVSDSDVVIENFSASTMDRLGLGFEQLRAWNPTIVYAQASAFGAFGEKDGFSYGPTAEAESGLTHLSGMPDREPAGWGFAFMDVSAGHLLAVAVLTALTAARGTGSAVHVDTSQVGTGIFLTGTAVLEHSVTGKPSRRWGNSGPPGGSTPGIQGVFRCAGREAWLAVSVHGEAQLASLGELLGRDLGGAPPEQRELWVAGWLSDQDPYAAMDRLQRVGVPAGVCQTPRDRVERDPQLAARGFLKLAHNREIGWWPVQDVPYRLSRSPAGVGLPGRPQASGHAIRRGAPVYDEDGDHLRSEARRRIRPQGGSTPPDRGPLAGLRVVELGDGASEFAGLLLAGAGAEVVKIEPPTGAPSRRLGPYAPDGSGLFFRQYNLGKRSVVLDLASAAGQRDLVGLVDSADIVVESQPPLLLDRLGLGADPALVRNPRLVWCAVTPFGQWGPWAHLVVDDFIQLALGGQMMMCGYDPVEGEGGEPVYDTPPIAPGRHQAAHVGGSQAATAILAALIERSSSGRGQVIDLSVHEALAASTEMGIPMWTHGGFEVGRQTARHAWPVPLAPTVFETRDRRFVYVTAVGHPSMWPRLRDVFLQHGADERVADPGLGEPSIRSTPDGARRVSEILRGFCLENDADDIVGWGQAAGLPWGVVRRPEENIADPHWRARGLFVNLPGPAGTDATHLGAPWVAPSMPWSARSPAPELGADTEAVLAGLGRRPLAQSEGRSSGP